MDGSMTVLITSAGRRVELLNLFRADAAALGISLRVLAADLRPAMSAACRLADASFAVPEIASAGYIDHLLALCAREHVALLVPLQDAELPLMAANRERFARAGTKVTISAPSVVAIARDKLATARAFSSAGIPTPRTARLDDVLADATGWTWPVIAKPADGAASVGVHIVPDRVALGTLSLKVDRARYLVQERCGGREYTVNVFFDRAGRVRCAVPHERLEVRAGEVSKGRTERQTALCAAAQKLGAALPGAWGPLCFQAFIDADGRAGIFEINARFGGGYPLAHRAGATFPRWLMEDALGREFSAHDNWRSDVLMLRHDSSIFVEEQG
jgi:carbamoyl-phosphate synthase large subunit